MMFSPIIAMACFKVLRWLCLLIAVLMAILFLRQWLIDDLLPRPFHLLYGATGFAFGAVCLWFAERWVKRTAGFEDK
jgi:hypothetical protein